MEEYKLKHIIGGTNGYTFKTLEECIDYYDEAYLKEDVVRDLFYYVILIDKAIEYIEDNKSYTTIEKFVKMNTFEKHDEDILDEEMINKLVNILKGSDK